MRRLFLHLLRDDCGAVNPEWMLIASVLVLGSVAALAAAKAILDGTVMELAKAAAGM